MDRKLHFSNNDMIGNNCRIYNDNCLNVLEKLPHKSVDLMFADPPYNLQLKQDLYRPNQTKVNGVDDAWDKFPQTLIMTNLLQTGLVPVVR